jgi:transposase InsO family protein
MVSHAPECRSTIHFRNLPNCHDYPGRRAALRGLRAPPPSQSKIPNVLWPEYVSGKLMECRETGIALSYIQPSKPQQNAYVERYDRTVRDEWLEQHIVESIEEA